MPIQGTSLKALNTFAINASANAIITASTPAELSAAWLAANKANKPFLLLGEAVTFCF